MISSRNPDALLVPFDMMGQAWSLQMTRSLKRLLPERAVVRVE